MTNKMTVAEILNNVEKFLEKDEQVRIDEHFKELSIFDWWKDYLSLKDLEDMRRFLREARKLGFTGYACFKVGVTGCANGMWAYKKESTTGYSPDGPVIYKSFTPAYNYWSINLNGDGFATDAEGEMIEFKSIRELETFCEDFR